MVCSAISQETNFSSEKVAMSAMAAISMNKSIQLSGKLDVYVLGNDNVAQALKKFQGQYVGGIILNSINSGEVLPKVKPSVIILCNDEKCENVIQYCRRNSVLSITNQPGLCCKGISLEIIKCQDSDCNDKYSLNDINLIINDVASHLENMQWYDGYEEVIRNVGNDDIYAKQSFGSLE